MTVFLIPVRINDINYGSHVGNDAFVSIIHEARMQWLSGNGFTELDIEGSGLIMATLNIQFKAEAFYGDLVRVEMSAQETSPIRFNLHYNLTTKRNEKTILLAIAQTEMVSYNYERKRPVEIPAALLKLVRTL